ncbi:MAG TPA: TetR/AcrR family transcriptional regulator [Acidimicrobiales bacterium]|nr:TetR/AcrR family transcriptional regulator [Acidimicrobiales bacterium]
MRTPRDRQAERRQATRAEILEAAWDLARTNGVAGLSLGDIARRIGMKTPSLYWYFESKHAIYDAMFTQGNEQLLARLELVRPGLSRRALLRTGARTFIEFCVEDLARYQLLFQRSIPDFEPTPEAYRSAIAVYEFMRERYAQVGITRQSQFDMWTALVSGLSAQQTSNDPGGDRWMRLVNPMVDMFLTAIDGATTPARNRSATRASAGS